MVNILDRGRGWNCIAHSTEHPLCMNLESVENAHAGVSECGGFPIIEGVVHSRLVEVRVVCRWTILSSCNCLCHAHISRVLPFIEMNPLWCNLL